MSKRLWLPLAVLAVLAVPAVAGCAGPAPADDFAVAAAPASSPSVAAAVVPAVVGLRSEVVDKEFSSAGVVAILRYEPGVVAEPGTVVSTDPPAGTAVPVGAAVTVVIAGPVSTTLPAYIDAHRETFVGVAYDSGVPTVAVYSRVDIAVAVAQISGIARGKPYRIRLCDRSYAELNRVMSELGRRDFTAGADKVSFAMSIDPATCAVRLTTDDLTDAQVAQLLARYQGALAVDIGEVSRASR